MLPGGRAGPAAAGPAIMIVLGTLGAEWVVRRLAQDCDRPAPGSERGIR